MFRISKRLGVGIGAGLPALVVSQQSHIKGRSINANMAHRSLKCEAPAVFAVRHAESVANVAKRESLEKQSTKYFWDNWRDDSELEPHERLRDCVLSSDGIAATIRAAEGMEKDNKDGRHILLVVSPLTRTMLTASLLFHRLQESGHPMTVIVEPACREVIVAPHDIVENLGRAPDVAVAEAEQILKKHSAPNSSIALLHRIGEAAKSLDPDWWFEATTPNNLPVTVVHSKKLERKENIRKKVKAHVAASEPCSRVYIICHWGVVYTLSDDRHAQNLQSVHIDRFLD